MKTIILFLVFTLGLTAQPADAIPVDLSNMTGNVLLGDDIGFEADCNVPVKSYITQNIDFNGYQITLNNSILYVEGDIEFGGSFRGACQATVCVLGGSIFNSDPPDPGGNPFDDPVTGEPASGPPNVPNPYTANECVDITDTVGWYEFYDLFTNPQKLSNEDVTLDNSMYSYDRNTKVLTVNGADYIYVYGMTGQRIKKTIETSISLKGIRNEMVIIITNKGHLKLIR